MSKLDALRRFKYMSSDQTSFTTSMRRLDARDDCPALFKAAATDAGSAGINDSYFLVFPTGHALVYRDDSIRIEL